MRNFRFQATRLGIVLGSLWLTSCGDETLGIPAGGQEQFQYTRACVPTSGQECQMWTCTNSTTSPGEVHCKAAQSSASPIPAGQYMCMSSSSEAQCPNLGPPGASWTCTASESMLDCRVTLAENPPGARCTSSISIGGNSGNDNNHINVSTMLSPCVGNISIGGNSGNHNNTLSITGPVGNLSIGGNSGNDNNTVTVGGSNDTDSSEACVINLSLGGSSGDHNNTIMLPNVASSCMGSFTGDPANPRCVINISIGGSSGNGNNTLNLEGLPSSCLGKITAGGSSGNNNNTITPAAQ